MRTLDSSVPVTLVITSYNRSDLVIEAIQSALAADPQPAEIIVVDDASSLESFKRLSEFCEGLGRVRLIRFSVNQGVSAARNFGALIASFDYITNLDGDDVIHGKSKFGNECKLLQAHADAAFAASTCVQRDMQDDRSEERAAPSDHLDNLNALNNVLSRSWIPRDPMYRKSDFFAIGGFNPNMSLFEDWDFKIRMLSKGGSIYTSAATGTEYRRWGGGLSNKSFYELDLTILKICWKHRGLFKASKTPLRPYLKKILRSARNEYSGRIRRSIKLQ